MIGMSVADLLARLDVPTSKIRAAYFKTTGLPIVQAPGGNGNGEPVATDVLTEKLAAGAGLLITDIFIDHLDDEGSDFIVWQIRENGLALPYYDKMAGSVGRTKQWFGVEALIKPGSTFSLTCLNYSGTEAVPATYPVSQSLRMAGMAKGFFYSR